MLAANSRRIHLVHLCRQYVRDVPDINRIKPVLRQQRSASPGLRYRQRDAKLQPNLLFVEFRLSIDRY